MYILLANILNNSAFLLSTSSDNKSLYPKLFVAIISGVGAGITAYQKKKKTDAENRRYEQQREMNRQQPMYSMMQQSQMPPMQQPQMPKNTALYTCDKCKRLFEESADNPPKHCPLCGALYGNSDDSEESVFCRNCGAKVQDDSSFCHKCGKPL